MRPEVNRTRLAVPWGLARPRDQRMHHDASTLVPMSTCATLAHDDLPVTVSFTRRADPAHAREMTAWIRAGLTMAESFPGFLGAGCVRPRSDADEWHMLVRFADQPALTGWEASPERRWWLRSAQGLTEVTRTERRTGIEGWFDRPVEAEVTTGRSQASPPAAPPHWKQATTIWLVFFPLTSSRPSPSARWSPT